MQTLARYFQRPHRRIYALVAALLVLGLFARTSPVMAAAPTVAITTPDGTAPVTGVVTISATAAADTLVSHVEFLVDGVTISVDADGSNGWSATWDTSSLLDLSAHSLTAIAVDDVAQSTTSAAVSVTVSNAAPTVSITAPDGTAPVAGIVSIEATAADDNAVTQVEFFANDGVTNTSLGIDTNGTDGWSVTWDTSTLAYLSAHSLTAVAADAAGQSTTSAAVNVTVSAWCALNVATNTRTCDLWAKAGTITMPDGAVVNIWGYADHASGAAGLPGPTLIANEGETLRVILHNNLLQNTSLAFRGTSLTPDTNGAAPGGTMTYTINNIQPGTHMYEAGLTTNGPRQVAMGMFGALIVRPTMGAGYAYNNAGTAFNKEAVLILSEIDPAFNASPDTFDMTNYAPKYWLINGKAYPNTDLILAEPGDKVLLRYLNPGLQFHSVGLLGVGQTIVGLDGSALTHPYSVVNEIVSPGQTQDMLVNMPAAATAGIMFPLFDAIHMNNNGQSFGGMITFLKTIDLRGPVTRDGIVSPNPTGGAPTVTLTAVADDTTTVGSNIFAAEWFDAALGDPGLGLANPMSALDGLFDSPIENIVATIDVSTWPVGTYTLGVRSQDDAGNWGATLNVSFDVSNGPPVVNAGPDQTLGFASTSPLSATMAGAATDDGRIAPLTTSWTQVAGPGIATFTDATALNTAVTFDLPGTYTLQLAAFDGEFTVTDTVDITLVVNAPPAVMAGPDQTIALPLSATLGGAVVDDGLLGPVTTTWSMSSGPGIVTFGDPAALNTTASFSVDGVYTLLLTAFDGEFTVTDDIIITVNPAPLVNAPPVVSAGPDQTIALPAAATLAGTATDDGLIAPLATTWSVLFGPDVVTIADPAALNTTATFVTPGTYVLMLTAFDGEFTEGSLVIITVEPPPSKHVGDLDYSSGPYIATTWYAAVTIRVEDVNHNPVSGATVSGAWSGSGTGGLSCTTGASGTCVVIRYGISSAETTNTFTVMDVTGAPGAGAYDALQNHDPDVGVQASDGTTFIVPMP